MTRVLVLGATGRAGSAVLAHLAGRAETTAAIRARRDLGRVPGHAHVAVVDLDDPATIRAALREADVVVNAVRLREDIPGNALIDLHHRITGSAPGAEPPLVVTVGGAGALRMPGGRRFWQDPAFPRVTLPRGRAHAALRDHLEAGDAGDRWTYLVPPPAFLPDAPATGRYHTYRPGTDESTFTRRSVGYRDFALAVSDVVLRPRVGTLLVAADG